MKPSMLHVSFTYYSLALASIMYPYSLYFKVSVLANCIRCMFLLFVCRLVLSHFVESILALFALCSSKGLSLARFCYSLNNIWFCNFPVEKLLYALSAFATLIFRAKNL